MKWVKTDRGIESGEWLVGPPPRPEVLAMAYIKMQDAGVLDKVFHACEPDLQWFLGWALDPKAYLIGCWQRSLISDQYALVGIGFVNSVQEHPALRRAEVGFAFWDSEIGPFAKAQLIRQMISYAMGTLGLDSLFGSTPDRNPAAAAIAKRAGMNQFGPIANFAIWHGQPCGVYLSQVDKWSWEYFPD